MNLFESIKKFNIPDYRKKVIANLYKVLVILTYIINLILIPLTFIILAIVLKSYWFMLGLLYIPIGIIISYLVSLLLLVGLGIFYDTADTSSNVKQIMKYYEEVNNIVKDTPTKTLSKKTTYQPLANTHISSKEKSEQHNNTDNQNKFWFCPKCGYKNSYTNTYCENCYQKRDK